MQTVFDTIYDNAVDKQITNGIFRKWPHNTILYVPLNKTLMLTKNVHLFVYCLMIFPRQKTAFVESFAENRRKHEF